MLLPNFVPVNTLYWTTSGEVVSGGISMLAVLGFREGIVGPIRRRLKE